MAERCRCWEEAVGGNVVRSQGGRGGEEGDSRGGHDVWLGGRGLLMGGGWWMLSRVREVGGVGETDVFFFSAKGGVCRRNKTVGGRVTLGVSRSGYHYGN